MSAALVEARKVALENMEALAASAADRTLTDDEQKRFDELEAEVADLDKRAALQAKAAELRAAAPAPVVDGGGTPDVRSAALQPTAGGGTPDVRAVSPYAEGSPNQFFVDMVQAKRGATDAARRTAVERLGAHYASTGDEASAMALRTYSSTTDSEGGYLVAPVNQQSEFVELVALGRPTANLVRRVPIDSGVLQYTDTVNIPKMLTGTAVAAHTENAALTETTATFGTVAVAIARRGGAATVPNFLLQRSMPGADGIIMADLAKRAAIDADSYVLNNTGTNAKGFFQETGLGGATYTAGTGTFAGLWPKLLAAVQAVSQGINEKPDAVIMHTRRWFWILAQLDSSSRPYVGALAPQNAMGDGGVQAPTGYGQSPALAGHILGIPVYLDDSIPTTFGAGTDEDRILIGKMNEAWLLETTPKFAVSTEAEFLKDQTLLRVTYDMGFSCARQKAAFAVVSGTGLNDSY